MPLRSHAGFGQPEMQRVIGAPRELGIDRDQILHGRDFRRQDDAVARQARSLRRARADSSADCTIASRMTSRASRGVALFGILVHQMREQFLVERTPIGADAHRLVVADRGLDNGAELLVLLVLEADIAGIDPVFVERLGAGRMIGQQLVADIMKIADRAARATPNFGSRSRICGTAAAASSRSTVMRTSLRAGARQRRDLPRRRLDVGGVGIGHRLHDDRRAAADGDAADIDATVSWRGAGARCVSVKSLASNLSDIAGPGVRDMGSARPVYQNEARHHQRHRRRQRPG